MQMGVRRRIPAEVPTTKSNRSWAGLRPIKDPCSLVSHLFISYYWKQNLPLSIKMKHGSPVTGVRRKHEQKDLHCFLPAQLLAKPSKAPNIVNISLHSSESQLHLPTDQHQNIRFLEGGCLFLGAASLPCVSGCTQLFRSISPCGCFNKGDHSQFYNLPAAVNANYNI